MSCKTHLFPVKLEPVFFTHIWGGALLRELYQKAIPADNTGESWEVSAHEKGQSQVVGGCFDGLSLTDYVEKICDIQCIDPPRRFPLLIKLIGPQKQLSVQVHPSDDYAFEHEGEPGKAEAWVVLCAPEGAQLVCGVKGSKDEFQQAIKDNRIEDCLRYMDIEPGDVIPIPAGLVHALSSGVVVYEVQQNSDTTYRLYDWGRVDQKTGQSRALHIDKALDVIDFDIVGKKSRGVTLIEPGGERNVLVVNDKYVLERIVVKAQWQDVLAASVDAVDFPAYTLIEGSGRVISEDREQWFDVSLGQTFIAPPMGGSWTFSGSATLLKGSCPGVHPVKTYLHNQGLDDHSSIFGL